jgi:6-phosphogluconolactonase (cycloisomerase 2 family)
MRRWTRVLPAALLLLAVAASASAETAPSGARRLFYAVSEAKADRGAIAVYDIDAGHRLIKRIATVSGIRDVRGVVASAATGRLYVAYRDRAGTGRIYCLDLAADKILWDRAVPPGVDRLAINPDGSLLYVPSWEGNTADFINVVDAGSGEVVRQVHFSHRSHDAQYPPAGPLFQETKAGDGTGHYLYRIDPKSYAISAIGPYASILGPYAVDASSRHVVNDVTGIWGMQVADLETGRIVTAILPGPPPHDLELPHGIGWTPDQREVWQAGTAADPHVYVWDMADPMAPLAKAPLRLRSGRGSHWLTFSIAGDYAYIAPPKDSDAGTEVFDAPHHAAVGVIQSSEEMLEIDFAGGRVSAVGDQYGIGRKSAGHTP